MDVLVLDNLMTVCWSSCRFFHLLVLVHIDFSMLVSEGGISNCTFAHICWISFDSRTFSARFWSSYISFFIGPQLVTNKMDLHNMSWAPENDWFSLFSVTIIIIIWFIWKVMVNLQRPGVWSCSETHNFLSHVNFIVSFGFFFFTFRWRWDLLVLACVLDTSKVESSYNNLFHSWSLKPIMNGPKSRAINSVSNVFWFFFKLT